MMDKPQARPQNRTQALLLILVVLYAMLAAGYFVLRYSGRWSDSDTANLTMTMVATRNEGTILPSRGYALGFLYPALSTFIAATTGVSFSQLQFLIYPLVAAGLSLIAFVLYRELLGDVTAGALAVLLLFIQPDFLFVIFRGSHEKVTWMMAMLAIFLLARSFSAAGRLLHAAAYTVFFYLAILGMVASNAFFGSSVIVAVGVSLIGGWLILFLSRREWAGDLARSSVLRLIYVTSAAMLVWFLDIFYLYLPARRILYELSTAAERAAAVSLGQEPRFDPYATVGWGWVSNAAYLALILPSFILAGLSFLSWAWMGLRHLLRRQNILDYAPRFLLWLMYGGFGVQMLISLVTSQTGGVASNLQQRIFPAAMMLGVPLVAQSIMWLWRSQKRAILTRGMAAALALFVLWGSGASLLKATNDPWLSNYWSFWTPVEDAGVAWVEEHIQYQSVWLGLDGIRLGAHAIAEGFGDESGNLSDVWGRDVRTRDAMISNLDRELSIRRFIPLPDIEGQNRVYDNGTSAHYHWRPLTPYQR
ncbi:MAG: hypothetical protein JW900_15815 [Anaerolineae bacterium]|nr:hypothetical protein [Anaerolineae bacterium]